MSKKFIKHGNSTIKLSAITGVSWNRSWNQFIGGGYRSGLTVEHGARVTIRVGDDATVTSYDSDALAEAAYDEIVASWENA